MLIAQESILIDNGAMLLFIGKLIFQPGLFRGTMQSSMRSGYQKKLVGTIDY